MMDTVLEVKNMKIALKEQDGLYPAVDNFAIALRKGKTLGIIGESGSGKSISCMAIMGLLDHEKWEYSGEVLLNGREIPFTDNIKMRTYRGRSIALIMQNPSSAFDPVYTIKRHFEETVRVHDRTAGKAEIKAQALEMLRQMHIKNTEDVYESYPFQCSGGMLQRIMIAIAVIQKPDVLIADEPTTALDLTMQHEIIKILKEVQARYNTSIIMVSHDLGVITHMADDITVMYSGNIVECGSARDVLSSPAHQYTQGLFRSRPAFSKERLSEVAGTQIGLKERGAGCQFFDRCPMKAEACLQYGMADRYVDGRLVRCCRIGG
ncbi:MAG: ABC transporter ATP-binding protein [Peptococcaceae bacterium]